MSNEQISGGESRLQREQEFHDQVFEHKERAAVGKYYKAAITSKKKYQDKVGELRNARVLEYGCGPGSQAFMLARQNCEVTGIDISPVAIQMSQEEADKQGVRERTHFHQMNAEALELPDGSFDAVIGSGILHHLELSTALKEVRRVLQPEGRAIFFEPLAHNPFIKLYRSLTPKLRSEDEHPLTSSDIRLIRSGFAESEVSWNHITSFAAGVFDNTPLFEPAAKVLLGLDTVLMTVIPPMRKLSWIVVIDLKQPHPPKPSE